MRFHSLFPIALTAMLSLGASPVLMAQAAAPTPKNPLPAPPYLKPAPSFSRWTVQYGEVKAASASAAPTEQTGGAQGKAAASPMQVRDVKVVRTTPFRMVSVSFAGGDHDELWSDGNAFVENSAKYGISIVAPMKDSVSTLDRYQISDFPEFHWVSKETYVDTVQFEKRSCLVFRESGEVKVEKPASDGMLDEPQPVTVMRVDPATVWIDEATRLPVRWQRGNEFRRVIFSEPPNAPLTVPPEIAKVMKQLLRLKEINAITAPKGG